MQASAIGTSHPTIPFVSEIPQEPKNVSSFHAEKEGLIQLIEKLKEAQTYLTENIKYHRPYQGTAGTLKHLCEQRLNALSVPEADKVYSTRQRDALLENIEKFVTSVSDHDLREPTVSEYLTVNQAETRATVYKTLRQNIRAQFADNFTQYPRPDTAHVALPIAQILVTVQARAIPSGVSAPSYVTLEFEQKTLPGIVQLLDARQTALRAKDEYLRRYQGDVGEMLLLTTERLNYLKRSAIKGSYSPDWKPTLPNNNLALSVYENLQMFVKPFESPMSKVTASQEKESAAVSKKPIAVLATAASPVSQELAVPVYVEPASRTNVFRDFLDVAKAMTKRWEIRTAAAAVVAVTALATLLILPAAVKSATKTKASVERLGYKEWLATCNEKISSQGIIPGLQSSNNSPQRSKDQTFAACMEDAPAAPGTFTQTPQTTLTPVSLAVGKKIEEPTAPVISKVKMSKVEEVKPAPILVSAQGTPVVAQKLSLPTSAPPPNLANSRAVTSRSSSDSSKPVGNPLDIAQKLIQEGALRNYPAIEAKAKKALQKGDSYRVGVAFADAAYQANMKTNNFHTGAPLFCAAGQLVDSTGENNRVARSILKNAQFSERFLNDRGLESVHSAKTIRRQLSGLGAGT